MRTIITGALAAAALTLALAGCSVGHDSGTNAAGASDGSSTPTASSSNPKFGQTVTYKDGLQVTVGVPTSYTPSASAAGATQAVNLQFPITVKNGTSKNFSPTLVTVAASSNGTEGSQITDLGNNSMGLPPTTDVLPGSSLSWSVAFSVADQASTILQISPGFSEEKAIFTN